MSKLGKVVAVVAVVGSVAWVGRQVVRHHHRAHELREEFHALRVAHENGGFQGGDNEHQVWAGHNNNVREFEEKDYGVHQWRGHQDDEEQDGGRRFRRRSSDDDFEGKRQWRRRHSDDFGSRRHHEDDDEEEGGHRRRHSDFGGWWRRRAEQRRQKQVDPAVGADGDVSVPDVEAANAQPRADIRFPPSDNEVPALEDDIRFPETSDIRFPDNGADIRFPPQDAAETSDIRFPNNAAVSGVTEIRFPEAETDDIRFPPEESDVSLSSDGNQRHHARRQRRGDEEQQSREVHFREFDHKDNSDEFTAEEKAEFRRLRKEARRLHCDAARTAGAFVAGAAFVGGVAHLRRLRRERRQAAAAAAQSVASAPQAALETASAPQAVNYAGSCNC